jgi:hypothetical protein
MAKTKDNTDQALEADAQAATSVTVAAAGSGVAGADTAGATQTAPADGSSTAGQEPGSGGGAAADGAASAAEPAAAAGVGNLQSSPVADHGLHHLFGELMEGAELLGHELLPEAIETVIEAIPGGEALKVIVAMTGLGPSAWNELPDLARKAAVSLGVKALQAQAGQISAIRAAVAAPQGTVDVTGRSRDGRDYRRAGVVWTALNQTVPLSPADVDLVGKDPHIVVVAAPVAAPAEQA